LNLNLNQEIESNLRFELISVLGDVVIEGAFEKNSKISVDLSEIDIGIYFINVFNEQNQLLLTRTILKTDVLGR